MCCVCGVHDVNIYVTRPIEAEQVTGLSAGCMECVDRKSILLPHFQRNSYNINNIFPRYNQCKMWMTMWYAPITVLFSCTRNTDFSVRPGMALICHYIEFVFAFKCVTKAPMRKSSYFQRFRVFTLPFPLNCWLCALRQLQYSIVVIYPSNNLRSFIEEPLCCVHYEIFTWPNRPAAGRELHEVQTRKIIPSTYFKQHYARAAEKSTILNTDSLVKTVLWVSNHTATLI